MQTPFDANATKAFRTQLANAGEQALAMNKQVMDFQLDQVRTADALARKNVTATLDFANKAVAKSAEMMLDMQRKGVEAMTTAADTDGADTAEA
jgi:hypothetical protein